MCGMMKGGMIDGNAAIEERAAELCPFVFQKELRDAIFYNTSKFDHQAVEKRRIYLVSSR